MKNIYLYLFKRAVFAVVTIFAVIIFNFIIFRILPGNPIDVLYGGKILSPQEIKMLYQQFGLNQPIWIQILIYLKNTLTGNLGISYTYDMPVSNLLYNFITNSLILGVPALILAVILGIWTGKIAGWKRGSIADSVTTNISMILWAIPSYWLGTLLILVVAKTGILPVSNMYTIGISYYGFVSQFVDILKHLILPLITLTLVTFGSYTLIMRNSMLDVVDEDFILTAKAKGIPEKVILNKHAVPNARLPIISMMAIHVGYLVGGLVLIETVFSWPGIGYAIYQAIMNRDYPLLQGAFLVIAISVILANFIADIIYLYIDPRIKYESAA
ncbi:MAG: ABC transporter permease [Caldisphaera sp.]